MKTMAVSDGVCVSTWGRVSLEHWLQSPLPPGRASPPSPEAPTATCCIQETSSSLKQRQTGLLHRARVLTAEAQACHESFKDIFCESQTLWFLLNSVFTVSSNDKMGSYDWVPTRWHDYQSNVKNNDEIHVRHGWQYLTLKIKQETKAPHNEL